MPRWFQSTTREFPNTNIVKQSRPYHVEICRISIHTSDQQVIVHCFFQFLHSPLMLSLSIIWTFIPERVGCIFLSQDIVYHTRFFQFCYGLFVFFKFDLVAENFQQTFLCVYFNEILGGSRLWQNTPLVK